MRSKRITLFTLGMLAFLASGCVFWLHRQRQQYAINRQLITALEKDDAKQAVFLLEAGADPNTRLDKLPMPSLREQIEQLLHRSPPPTNDSPTAFMFACGDGYSRMSSRNPHPEVLLDNPRLLTLMLEHGAEVHPRSKHEWNALGVAIFYDRPRVVELLVQYGVNVNLPRDYPPLLMAVEWSDDPILIRGLLAHGADVNAKDFGGTTPLMAAVPFGTEIVRLLLERGADVNRQDQAGNTALHKTLDKEAHKDIIRLLLAHGANPNLRNHAGVTPLQLAQRQHHADIVALFKHAGAKK